MDRPIMAEESVTEPVVDELSVSVRVSDIDLAEIGDLSSEVFRAREIELAIDVDNVGRLEPLDILDMSLAVVLDATGCFPAALALSLG